MKLNTIQDVREFQATIDECKDDVWLVSQNERYNLKSALSQLVALGKVLSGDESLELFTSSREDEQNFFKLFQAHPEFI